MKVLFINTVYKRGSTGRIVADLGHMLEENGHEFKVAYGRGDHSDDSHCYRVGNDLDMYVHAGLSRITDQAGFYSKRATKRLVHFIKEYNPDIIHLHNLHGYYLNIEVLFNYLADEYRGRVIWTLHDCWAFTGHCTHFTYAGCDKWKEEGCSKCPEKRRYPKSYFADLSKENYLRKKELFTSVNSMTIVTPSNWLMNKVKCSFLKKLSVQVINNGIDTEVFNNENKNFANEKILLSVMDGLDERKGYQDLKIISQKLYGEYKTMIVGLKGMEIRHLPGSIEGIPRTDSIKELISYYRKAEYFINTTYEDTFPTVNIEALACGTPVITYDSGGSPEILDSRCGFIVKRGDIDSIISIIRNHTRPESIECRRRAKEFEKKKKYREYLELYKSLT